MTIISANARDFITNFHLVSKEFSTYGSETKSMTPVLRENRVYACKVDYPFETGFTFNIKVGEKPITLRGFATRLSNAYKKHYEKIDSEKIVDGYWHGMGDLFLEKIMVNDETNTIEVWIGS